MAQPSLVNVNLATVAIESLFYGIFLVLAATSLCLLFARARSQQPVSWSAYYTPIMLGCVGMIMTVTGVRPSIFTKVRRLGSSAWIALGHDCDSPLRGVRQFFGGH